MYEHERDSKKQITGAATFGSTSAQESERRGDDRHVFTASAEVREIGSGARFSTRTTDLGPGGCFVDTMVPLPIGARVQVNVHKDKNAFEATGTVVYAQTGLGMGIAFDTLTESQRDALDAWLGELGWQSGKGEPIARSAGFGADPKLANRTSNQQAAVARLVRLLISKGLLTEAEGSSVLFDPVL